MRLWVKRNEDGTFTVSLDDRRGATGDRYVRPAKDKAEVLAKAAELDGLWRAKKAAIVAARRGVGP